MAPAIHKSPDVNFNFNKLLKFPFAKTAVTPIKQIIIPIIPYLLIFSLNKKKENKIINIGEAE